MVKTAFKVAYIGTDYYGFQRQPNLPTIEGELLRAFKIANISDNPEKSDYSIAGRTDRGVHAMGNVVSLNTDKEVRLNQINYHLPVNIQIIGITTVPNGFKPRYAKYRHYRYIMSNLDHDDVIDINLMQEASKLMVGTHNYQNFSKRSERVAERTVYSVNIRKTHETLIFDVVGQSFLWNMVRKMVTILTMVGRDELSLNELKLLFNPDIYASIIPAPSEGLILMDVVYEGIKFSCDNYAKNNFLKTLKEEYNSQKTILDVEKEMINVLKDINNPKKP